MFSISAWFKKVEAEAASWFHAHAPAIETGVKEAQSAAGDAVAIATEVDPALVTPLQGVVVGLGKLSTFVQTEVSATTLQQAVTGATQLATAITSLTPASEKTQAAVANVADKVNGVTTVLQNALNGAPAAATV